MRYIYAAVAVMVLFAGCVQKPAPQRSSTHVTHSKKTPGKQKKRKLDACTRAAGLLPRPEYGFRGVAFEKLDAKKAAEVCSRRVKAAPNDAHAKFLLARALTKQQKYAEALPLLEASCKMGDDGGCTLLGSYYFTGNKPAKFDRKRAAELYEEACSHNYAPACTSLGVSYLFGSDKTKKAAEGEEMIFRECKKGYVQACKYYITFTGYKMIPATGDHYLVAAQTMCEKGHECNYYWKMSETRHSSVSAHENAMFTAHVCKSGAAVACEKMGDYYHSGRGVRRNYKKALDMYLKACNAGRKHTACWKAGMIIYKSGGNRQRVYGLLSLSCHQGHNTNACVDLASIFLAEPSAAPNPNAARNLLKEACQRGNAEGCSVLKQRN